MDVDLYTSEDVFKGHGAGFLYFNGSKYFTDIKILKATDYSKTMAFKVNVRWNHKIKCIPSQKRKERTRRR